MVQLMPLHAILKPHDLLRHLNPDWFYVSETGTCISLQIDNHTNTSSLNVYRPDALPDAQPTASKHRMQLIHI